ncbi:MAG TPA: hypothetical protein VNL71_02490, partial [Chloroflexota bacterium]|nr:hypothetical protein [Chloroflexota bacterium]
MAGKNVVVGWRGKAFRAPTIQGHLIVADGQAKEGTGYAHLTEPHSKQLVRKTDAAVPILDRVYRHAP